MSPKQHRDRQSARHAGTGPRPQPDVGARAGRGIHERVDLVVDPVVRDFGADCEPVRDAIGEAKRQDVVVVLEVNEGVADTG